MPCTDNRTDNLCTSSKPNKHSWGMPGSFLGLPQPYLTVQVLAWHIYCGSCDFWY
ncbi:hypothetical protein PAXRUDRAFT_835290 [Paxillus rubicundulus Ve08.2h10]|uniref:Uncharacterized protein n=1 Tax=Paxillus rubicundulus Ve08.2h10 TaxID=930991 RepID=A0A0D0CZB9_9AGAM|nr:hypothetical protein PAXRUDRAFT_835290 [Paxillus rubicundulus Ve08.2h10]